MKQLVEIIIPTYKPGDRIRLLLQSLAGQTYPAVHVHIINTEEEYWKEEFIPDMGEVTVRVTHIKPEEFDHGGTRALGVKQSQGEFVLFMTQDAVPADADMVAKLVEALEAVPDAAVAYARQLPAEGQSDYIENFTRKFNYPEQSHIKSRDDIKTMGIKAFFCSDVCAMYRKSLYNAVGGFVSPTVFNEDMIFAADAINAGYKVVYCAEAKVYHSHRYTGMQLIRRNFDMGVSQRDYSERFRVVSSEKEGTRLVRQTAGYLFKSGKGYLVIRLIWTSACKYIGYLLGKHYNVLPKSIVRGLSLSRGYWDRKLG